MKYVALVIGIVLTASSASVVMAMNEQAEQILSSLPDTLMGWARGDILQWDAGNLFDYMDGGAELFLSYGFRSLASRTYSRPGYPDIVVDLFDMANAHNAFGVFSHSREAIDSSIGQGSQYEHGLLLFWKGRFYVSILAFPESAESRAAVKSLGAAIASRIRERGALPHVVLLLPEASLMKHTVRYFSNHALLNSHYFVADTDILHIDTSCGAALAKYGDGARPSILLVVEYRNKEDARRALADFTASYLPEHSGGRCARVENGRWVCCRCMDTVLSVVFEAVTEDVGESLTAKVHQRLKTGIPHE
jgi:hypothetical protein